MKFKTCLTAEPQGSVLSRVPQLPRLSPKLTVKRGVDLLGASVLLVLCLPLFPLIAYIIKRRKSSQGQVFSLHEFVGLHYKPFKARQFNTRGAERGFLATTGLDRLPQLINVLKGEMSLVGPCPVTTAEMDSMGKWRQLRRFAMKPGVKGPWLFFRESGPSTSQSSRDVHYVSRWTLWQDLVYLAKPVVPLWLGRALRGSRG
ncbi:MAG TPA: sugar transferase [Acidobacteriota bacterium]|nr:sugar transferase [Acidobacteriota bacterium]